MAPFPTTPVCFEHDNITFQTVVDLDMHVHRVICDICKTEIRLSPPTNPSSFFQHRKSRNCLKKATEAGLPLPVTVSHLCSLQWVPDGNGI